MAPNIFGIWTPRNSSPRRFRAWTHTPNIQEYTSPPTPKQLPTPKSRRTISTDLDEAAVAELTTQAQAWRKEAAKLEKEAAAMVESQDTAEMGVATPWLWGEAKVPRLQAWHARMVEGYPVRFKNKTGACKVWAK